MINDHKFADGEKLNIVGHSHGGNVGILASEMTDKQVDNLVTLGTPNRLMYQPNKNKIENHINVYSRFDLAQKAAEIGDPVGIVGNNDSRKFSGAENIGVGLRAGIFPRGSHTNLWQNSSVWSLVNTKADSLKK